MTRRLSERRLPGVIFFCIILQTTAWAGPRLPQADGGVLELPRPAERLITLSPHLAELAFAAGAGSRLLATAEYSNYPDAAAALPRIGDAFRLDLERILALKPDLVIAWESGNPGSALNRLESIGLPVWRTEIRRPEDIAGLLDAIASAAGLPPPSAAGEARALLEGIRTRHAGAEPISFFYQVAERPLFTLNGEHLVSQGLAICGGRNIFANEPVLAPQVSIEAVLQADPGVLIAPALPGEHDPLAHWRGWPRMVAVQANAFLLLPADAISRATPRTLKTLDDACRALDAFRSNRNEDFRE